MGGLTIAGRQERSARFARRDRRVSGPSGWWSIVDYKIGIIPLPVFVILLAVIAGFALTGKVPSDILMAIVLLSMGGFTCAELGKRIPIIRNIGAAAIFATFIPSFLAFHHLLPASILDSVKDFTKDFELPVPVHFLHHRRQHPGDGPRRPDQGLPQDIHSAGRGLGRRRHRRDAGRRPARPRRLSHVLLCRGPDHGRRRRRRSDPALDRLFANPAPAAGRSVCAGIAAGDARQPDRHSAGGYAQLCRQEISASHRRRAPATGRARRT